MYGNELANRTAQAARDLAEALTAAPRSAAPANAPQLGPLPGTPQPVPSPPPGLLAPSAPGGAPSAPGPILPPRPGQSMAMQNLTMRPPTQNPMMGGLAQVKAFAKGGVVRASSGGAWTRKEGKNPEGGLNAKGRASLRAQGHNIKPPVSAKQAAKSPKAAARRKSFCVRMSGMPGPMKDEKGRPTRKALSLRKWECR